MAGHEQKEKLVLISGYAFAMIKFQSISKSLSSAAYMLFSLLGVVASLCDLFALLAQVRACNGHLMNEVSLGGSV